MKGHTGIVWIKGLQPMDRGKNLQVLIPYTMETGVWAEGEEMLIVESWPFHLKDRIPPCLNMHCKYMQVCVLFMSQDQYAEISISELITCI